MATQTKAADPARVVTGRVRLSYVHLFEAYTSGDDEDAKFSVTLLIPKTDTATMDKLRAAQKAALEKGKATKFGGRIPKDWTDTIHDGDEEADLEKNPEYAGHWYMNVGSRVKPGIIDRMKRPIEDSTEVYSGCYARVALGAYPYKIKGNQGVSFGLNHVQKLADGESLTGRTRAEDAFDDLDDDEDLDDDDLI